MAKSPYDLVLFDCDGTIADSQGSIVHSVQAAFRDLGLAPPSAERIRRRVGLSLEHFVAGLGVDVEELDVDRLLALYRENFARYRAQNGSDPLFPGLGDLLDELRHRGVLLGVVTGKSRRGLRRLLEDHGRWEQFATFQTADDAPSKPDPTMVRQALEDTGVDAGRAVVVGDTVYDMEAARRAGVDAIGVEWGHHPTEHLREAGAQVVVADPAHLRKILIPD